MKKSLVTINVGIGKSEIEEMLMSSVEAIKQAIAAEAQEVKTHVDELTAEIVSLKEQIANGAGVTVEQLQELEDLAKNIFTTPSNPDPEA